MAHCKFSIALPKIGQTQIKILSLLGFCSPIAGTNPVVFVDNCPILMTQGANTYTFKYTSLGDHRQQTVNGTPTTYTLDINTGLTQVLADGANIYLYGNGRIVQYVGTTPSYFLSDALGSVRQMTSITGSVALAKSYEPYGEVLSSTGSATSIYGWTGEIADNTGLTYLRARYYASGQGRFITRDTWASDMKHPLSYNMWLYGYANPTNLTDPSGLCVLCNANERVKVNGDISIYSEPNPYSVKIGNLANNEYVRVATSRPLPADFTAGGRDAWRKIIIPTDPFDDVPSTQFGWVRNIALLDNCMGGIRKFGCLPIAGWTNEAYGFGPNDYAQRNCEVPGSSTCPYNVLRGLHNGFDFPAGAGSPLIWIGTSEGVVRNLYGGDADPNIVVQYGVRYVLYGHISQSYVQSGETVRPGQTIGESGGDHLHLGVRAGNHTYYNPLYFFKLELQSRIVARTRQYPDGYGPYSLISFGSDKGGWFWGDCPDLSGIIWQPNSSGDPYLGP